MGHRRNGRPFSTVITNTMRKTAKLTCLLVGTLLVAVLAMSLIVDQRRTGKISSFMQNLLSILMGQRRTSKIGRCYDNLRTILLIKTDWEQDKLKTTNDVPTWNDLRGFFPARWSNSIPICPESGSYKINRVNEPPTCSIGGPGHSLQ
jgi:hypothetical protein